MSFPLFETHVCLVSQQTLPNYLGVLVPEVPPRNVHLIVTNQMGQQAGILEKALKIRGCQVRQHAIQDAAPNTVFDALCALEESLGNERVAINVTGGTKPMALAAMEWANVSEKKHFAFYVDTDNDQVLQMTGDLNTYSLSCRLSIKQVLLAGAGRNILSQNKESIKAEERQALRDMLELCVREPRALAHFNYCAAQGTPDEKPWSAKVARVFDRAMELAISLGKVRADDGCLAYASEAARKWCNGGWLEDYVKDVLFSLRAKKKIDDFASNIELEFAEKVSGVDADAPENEIDAAFTCANRLYLIECKTSNLSPQKKVDHKAEEAINKLNTLRSRLGGVFGKGMLVSVFAPRPVDRQRCNDLRLNLVCRADVLGLEKKIIEWIGHGRS